MSKDNMKKRIGYIDFLKFIGLTSIIIAHVGSPDWLMMLRNFDVPLMVVISSLLASYSIKKYKEDKKSILDYYISRFKRLVIPTYIFLIIYLTIKTIVTKEIMGAEYYLATFLLTRYGLGYVWIILVYLYSAFLIPIYRKIGFSTKNTLIILLIYVLYELLFFCGIGTSNRIVETTLFFIIPYGLLTYIGFNFEKISNKQKKILALINIVLFISLSIYYFIKTGSLQSVQTAKYPPRMYYLSYGLSWSIILMMFCNKYSFRIFKNKTIRFISKHSMWIYLWHILILDVYNYLNLPKIWFVKLLIVYATTIIIVLTINRIIDLIEKRHKYKFLQYLR